MFFRQIYDEKLAQYAYLVACQRTKEALVIDPERDVDRYVRLAAAEGFTIVAAAETHIHADFLSGARELAWRYGTLIYLSAEGGPDWQYAWADEYDAVLLRDGDTFTVGSIRIQARHTPGHTPEHLGYLITDTGSGATAPIGLISGDFVFVGDVGRPDLLETAAGRQGTMRASAKQLYRSAQSFLELDDFVQVWPGHGAGSACGKALGAVPESTVGYEKRFNPALAAAEDGESRFVEYVLSDQPEPPLYFARMKALNRQGPPILADLPRPSRLSTDNLETLATSREAAILDTRSDRHAFMEAHIPGSLHASLDLNFLNVAGSYVEPERPIYLVVEEHRLEEALRALVRIGLDQIDGYLTPTTLEMYAQLGGPLASTEIIDFHQLEHRREAYGVRVLDVRRSDEYDAGHIPGALHVPYVQLPARLGEIPRSPTLLVHCASGARAAAAVALLEKHDYRAVLVDGDFENWSNAYAGAVQSVH
ncbi:MAG TPA: MBL fold metallo-hydrolase [Rhodothermales bacterium]|nr:MBL fold metallo-hydrolase [Rhodothermales bacterium]